MDLTVDENAVIKLWREEAEDYLDRVVNGNHCPYLNFRVDDLYWKYKESNLSIKDFLDLQQMYNIMGV